MCTPCKSSHSCSSVQTQNLRRYVGCVHSLHRLALSGCAQVLMMRIWLLSELRVARFGCAGAPFASSAASMYVYSLLQLCVQSADCRVVNVDHVSSMLLTLVAVYMYMAGDVVSAAAGGRLWPRAVRHVHVHTQPWCGSTCRTWSSEHVCKESMYVINVTRRVDSALCSKTTTVDDIIDVRKTSSLG